jgi:hypothetical protein
LKRAHFRITPRARCICADQREQRTGCKMLYIFRVDTGSMMTLEMSLALETVAHLR